MTVGRRRALVSARDTCGLFFFGLGGVVDDEMVDDRERVVGVQEMCFQRCGRGVGVYHRVLQIC